MKTSFKVGFIGNFQTGYVGEIADEIHICQEIEDLGHTVYRINRDEWREYVLEDSPVGRYPHVPENETFDICIFAKWHHFYDGRFIEKAREKYGCPCFYWCWDFMWNGGMPDWHTKMVNASDLYLGNDVRATNLYKEVGIDLKKLYYFPFDVASKLYDRIRLPKKYDTVFFGSYIGQGDRVEWLKKINEKIPVKIFGWGWENWQKVGFDAEPPVYDYIFMQKVAESKIMLGFNVNDYCWGYWSNRVGKTLTLGGFLLQRYVPGMELFLREGAEYFSSVDEAVEKINYYLAHDEEREAIAERGYRIGRDRFTSESRVKELMILVDRYLKGVFNENLQIV